MPTTWLVPVILISVVYLIIVFMLLGEKLEEEKAVRSDLVRSALFKFVIVSGALGVVMDLSLKSYGKYTVIMTVLVVGSFLISMERLKRKYREEKED
ncbi:hypothetical protein [Candidatus Leptofilum sp.]|uniref:hypothetical protein n=1 Tax=Candidatus Leptofilum sp. TaxID=3241576 RepID=UPI003B5AF388